MSGGQWDYCGSRIRSELEMIAEDPLVRKRWPRIARLFADLSQIIYDAEHTMDWDLSGDTVIPDDKKFEVRICADALASVIKILDMKPL